MAIIANIVITLVVMTLLTGCFGMDITPDTPKGYSESNNTIESLYGSTKEKVIRELGKPEWIETRNDSTYFIYEWRNTDKEIVFMLAFIPYPVPVPIGGGRTNINWYCLLLEFDHDNRLIHHETAETSYGDPAPWGTLGDTPEKQINCLNHFKKEPIVNIGPGIVINKTKLDTEGPDRGYEYTVEMLDKRQKLNVVSKHIGFHIGACVNVITTKLDVSLASGNCIEYKECLKEVEMHIHNQDRMLYKDICTFCKKADLSDADAQTYIGDIYYLGAYDLRKDFMQAYVWYSLAANNGNSYAAKQLEKVVIELSPEQLDEAQERREQWTPGQCESDLIEAISKKDE
jgi:hypothetical protein